MIPERLRRELAKQAREFARPERRVRSLGKSVYYLGENRRILRRFFSPRITLINANGKEVVWISRSFWSATRLRVALDRTEHDRKAVRGRPHSQSTSCEALLDRVIRIAKGESSMPCHPIRAISAIRGLSFGLRLRHSVKPAGLKNPKIMLTRFRAFR